MKIRGTPGLSFRKTREIEKYRNFTISDPEIKECGV